MLFRNLQKNIDCTVVRTCRCNIDCTVPADETGVPQDLVLLLLLRPQVSKGVNDHTKDQVKYNNNDHEEERKVVDDTREEPERRISKPRQNF